MKYIKPYRKIFENIDDRKAELENCFYNISDVRPVAQNVQVLDRTSGFFVIDLLPFNTEYFEYNFSLVDDLTDSLERALDLGFVFHQSRIDPYNINTGKEKCMSSTICSSKSNNLNQINMQSWLGEEFPEPKDLYFIPYPLYRKGHPVKKSDFLHTIKIEKIDFVFFEM